MCKTVNTYEINKTNLKRLICGIRFNKDFRLGSISGDMMNTVLYKNESLFSTTFFPKYEDRVIGHRRLYDDTSGKEVSLDISYSDIIFQYEIRQHDDIDGEIEWFINNPVEFIIKELITGYKISQIIRVGFMFEHTFNNDNLGMHILSKGIDNDIRHSDGFTLRFNEADVTSVGKLKKEKNDLRHKITSIQQNRKPLSDPSKNDIHIDEYKITFDYQYLFRPFRNKIDDWEYKAFYDNGVKILNNEFYKRINKLIKATQSK